MNNFWVLENTRYNEEEHLHLAPVNTVGNGLVCCRGFFEEQQEGIAGLGGIYMAGVFGRASYKPWKGVGQELVNVPNFLWVRICIDGKALHVKEQNITELTEGLNMKDGVYTRSYTYCEQDKPLVKLAFSRFASQADIYTVGQSIALTPLQDGLCITVECGINTNITNLNEVSCEPHPIQPGRKQCEEIFHNCDVAEVAIEGENAIRVAFAQKILAEGLPVQTTEQPYLYTIQTDKGHTTQLQKLVALALSTEDGENVREAVQNRLQNLPTYDVALQHHIQAMHTWWGKADVEIEGAGQNQLALRYSILQLMQACPRHTNQYSIGARGLTGEMYEGSVFWDTEIFMLPFFTLTNPEAGRKLLEFRYKTLPEARQHAQSNWFEGAMYGWQVNAQGVEQTPQGVGAYYSIHVVADIAFSILEYWHCTGDEAFVLQSGLEILIETARFWASRVTLREDGQYDIMAVRGPNEYDVLVNNNLYTNIMARENFILCAQLLALFEQKAPQQLATLKAKLNFKQEETHLWNEICEKIILPFNAERNLWLEDDAYLRRRPLDMKRAKPTGKRIIDTTIPYEALPFYQVSKQADVLQAMKQLPWYFTQQQIETAYGFYKPKTAFDSSLAYSMFALMAARLGHTQDALQYFDVTANLDIRNVQLNTISGLHFANFGGTWQGAIFGFAGVSVEKDGVMVAPHLPKEWCKMNFKLHYQGALLHFSIAHNSIQVKLTEPQNKPITLWLAGNKHVLEQQDQMATEMLGGQS